MSLINAMHGCYRNTGSLTKMPHDILWQLTCQECSVFEFFVVVVVINVKCKLSFRRTHCIIQHKEHLGLLRFKVLVAVRVIRMCVILQYFVAIQRLLRYSHLTADARHHDFLKLQF